MSTLHADKVLDCSGVLCPMPIVSVSKAIKEIAAELRLDEAAPRRDVVTAVRAPGGSPLALALPHATDPGQALVHPANHPKGVDDAPAEPHPANGGRPVPDGHVEGRRAVAPRGRRQPAALRSQYIAAARRQRQASPSAVAASLVGSLVSILHPGRRRHPGAMAPARTDYYYFVSRNDGTHQFSSDFRTHSLAVLRYQKHRP